MTKLIALFAVFVCAAPAAAGPSTCFAGCATKHDGRQAACRVKSGSDVVKSCLDKANADYQGCRQSCTNKYKLQEKPQTGGYGTQPSSGTQNAPQQPPTK